MCHKRIASVMLVVGMFFAVSLLNNMEIIFPEISALAIGAWVMERSPWQGRKLNLWLSPTLAAFTGMFLIKFFSWPPLLMIVVALILVIIQLRLLQSEVFPAISAAILPIIVHADSWLYPVAVGTLTAIILLGKIIIEADSKKADNNFLQMQSANSVQSAEAAADFVQDIHPVESFGVVLYWVKIALIVTLVAALAVGLDIIYILAPPLIVVFVELAGAKEVSWSKYFKVLVLIILAAFSGVFWITIIVNYLHLPFWVFGCFAMLWIFALYHWIGITLPPASALTLLPAIVPSDQLFFYPFQVALGCTLFVIFAAVVSGGFIKKEVQEDR